MQLEMTATDQILEQFGDWAAIVHAFSQHVPVGQAPPDAVIGLVNWAARIADLDDEHGGPLTPDERAYLEEIQGHRDRYTRFGRAYASAGLN